MFCSADKRRYPERKFYKNRVQNNDLQLNYADEVVKILVDTSESIIYERGTT